MISAQRLALRGWSELLRACKCGSFGDDVVSPEREGGGIGERKLNEATLVIAVMSERPHSSRVRAVQMGAFIRSWMSVACAKASSVLPGLSSLVASMPM